MKEGRRQGEGGKRKEERGRKELEGRKEEGYQGEGMGERKCE